MSIELKEDLTNNKLLVCVCLEEKLKLSQPTERVHWTQVVKHVEENYTPPKGYVLGKCEDLYKVADNNHKKQCNIQWEYKIIEKISKTTKKTTKTTKKTTIDKSK
tara:strand:+ start:116 stop:430 length:315 start_codon:yes stop_codon:yes gene_type:complete